jgi:hypothetical protein
MSEFMPGINKQKKTFGWRSLNLSFLPLRVFYLYLKKIAFPSEDQTLRGLEKKVRTTTASNGKKSEYVHQNISLTIFNFKST